MTPEEHCDEIAKELYMGTVPDAWNSIARSLILRHLQEVYAEGYQEGRKD